ncbi:gamma-glutamyl-gamma-aminobutyrate hydrolase family protein [Pokkaliibacter sp. CJK22405]|uniref:gamma-glutamyl-gamma-aminobutyrate hydrolase family protein n=1 Tax=Pokkaliibacter sp. CJK22405 TaxID=3384615 RepID=UPI0039852AC0
MAEARPLIGLQSDVFLRGSAPFHGVGEKYIQALTHGADAYPWLLPALLVPGQELTPVSDDYLDGLLARMDGLFLPGSHSNLEGWRYGLPPDPDDSSQRDPQRDASSLLLIRRALSMGMPILAVCRGMQEVNVALGGTLHPFLHQVEGLQEHREDKDAPREEQYRYAHRLTLLQGGALSSMTQTCHWQVNSLHGQGIDRLAPDLQAEAWAEDGLVEAFSFPDDSRWLIGVQWHPEWRYAEDALSTQLFARFGEAARRYRQQRLNTSSPQALCAAKGETTDPSGDHYVR